MTDSKVSVVLETVGVSPVTGDTTQVDGRRPLHTHNTNASPMF